jgi:transcriptional regulator with XRE-family HTH domain
MSRLLEQLRETFSDEEYRYAYTESFMNSYIAAQIKVLREEFGLSRDELARRIGTTKTIISRLENVGYSSWKLDVLKKLARALGLRLKIGFEEFGSLPEEVDNFRREMLLRVPFDRDPAFSPESVSASQGRPDDLALQRQLPPADAYPEKSFALGEVYLDATRTSGAA